MNKPLNYYHLLLLLLWRHVIKERLLKVDVYEGLRQTPDVNLYHVTNFSPHFPFTIYCFYTRISSLMPVFNHRNRSELFLSAYFLF